MAVIESPRRSLTRSQQDYLKALYHLGGGASLVNTSQLAERLGVSPASATEMLGKLAALALVHHDRYRGAGLTAEGETVALEMVRHHRLVEMFLVEKLGFGWDEVHEEAELLEHVISERLEDRIFQSLGRPQIDCHGDPIPSRAGRVASARYRSLAEVRRTETVTVRRVSDRDPGKLRELGRLGLKLGAQLAVLRESQYEGPIAVRLGTRQRQVPLGLAREVFVA
ncbi:MAG: metal-dependent transcriptional regulator [Candidatus Dormibacteraeota bacterium]|nr:metal-dependent transcriptional regulator [Candidatus Dormibacteraeota bacterium]